MPRGGGGGGLILLLSALPLEGGWEVMDIGETAYTSNRDSRPGPWLQSEQACQL